jgi:hypothetical protein
VTFLGKTNEFKNKAVSFNVSDPLQLKLYEHATKTTNFSNYIKFLIAKDIEVVITQPEPPDIPEEEPIIEADPVEEGFIYFIEEQNSNTVKIGKTNNLLDRMRTFNVKLPFVWDLIGYYKTDHMSKLESGLHKHFSAKRVNGEWYELTLRDLSDIKKQRLPLEITELIKEFIRM